MDDKLVAANYGIVFPDDTAIVPDGMHNGCRAYHSAAAAESIRGRLGTDICTFGARISYYLDKAEPSSANPQMSPT